jgi:Nuclease-related domain
MHHRSARTVTCAPCAALSDGPLEVGTPGASAAREYDRRKASRAQRAVEKFGALSTIAVRLADEPQQQAAWARGARGEAKLASRLAQLLDGSGVIVLHDRRIPRSRANIDHLAVGPGGVTVIDAKNHKGKVRVERRGGLLRRRTEHLIVAGRDRTALVDAVERQVSVVSHALVSTADGVDVRGAVCFVEVDGLPLLGRLRLRDVIIDGPKTVGRLASRPGHLDRPTIDRLVRTLAAALPVA